MLILNLILVLIQTLAFSTKKSTLLVKNVEKPHPEHNVTGNYGCNKFQIEWIDYLFLGMTRWRSSTTATLGILDVYCTT